MEIRPFCGWRYKPPTGRDISSFIAPPYDVLTAEDKENLLSRDERNIVAVDLPHVPPWEMGPEQVYRDAAALLESWIAGGLLCRDNQPAIYAYRQTYTWAGKTHIRRAMLCGLRATPLGQDKGIIPHEHTFAGPKADRLKLTECTRKQLSPIFAFFDDPAGAATDAIWSSASGQPDLCGRLGDVTEELWVIDDQAVIEKVTSTLRDIPAFIADGHHRYTTAMNYRDTLLAEGKIDNEHEANFVMFALVAAADPGLLVLPTHRIVNGLNDSFSSDKLYQALTDTFDVKKLDNADADLTDADALLGPMGVGTIAVIDADDIQTIKLVKPDAMLAAAPDEPDPWRKLDVAVLHELILDRALSPWKTDDFKVEYTPDGNQAKKAVRDGEAQIAFCLQGTPLQSVIDVALAGAAMPHKSTYFYPKLATGMVVKPLE